MNNISVVILAGGIGKRFFPFSTSKTLIPFMGKPLLQHLIETVHEAGFDTIIIVGNHDNTQWIEHYARDKHISIKQVQQKEPRGMGDALRAAKQIIGSAPCIILNAADRIEKSLLKEIQLKAEQDPHTGIIVGKEMDAYFPGGYIIMRDGKATGIIEKPSPENRPSNLVKLVCDYIPEPHVFIDHIEKISSEKDDHYEQALQHVMNTKPFTLISYTGSWTSLKYAHHVLNMMEDFLEQSVTSFIHASAHIAQQAVIEGSVYIDEGVKIYEGAVIKGPVYIGKNSIVGNHTLVRHAMIEAHATVGFGCEISRSYIGPGCTLHHNYLGDSVLEADVNPSYGSCSANLRLDHKPVILRLPNQNYDTGRTKLGVIMGKDVFSGIHCAFMPGVTIGSHARIYPGVTVHRCVSENEIVKE